MSSLKENRKKLFKGLGMVALKKNNAKLFRQKFPDFDTFEQKMFVSEEKVKELKKLLSYWGVPGSNISDKDFFEMFACDLLPSVSYCSSTPVPVKPEPVKPEPVKPEPVKPEIPPPDTSCPPAVSGDTSENSPNKKEDPGGGGKIYNIPGDPYKWRIGEDGGWWAKRDSQSKWNNISGQVNRCEKPKWRISIDTMDRKYFNGDATRRVAAKNEVNESNNNTQNSFRLGKFFID